MMLRKIARHKRFPTGPNEERKQKVRCQNMLAITKKGLTQRYPKISRDANKLLSDKSYRQNVCHTPYKTFQIVFEEAAK
uniref:Uncharacterized protein n=1 Tax=Rhizophagus irregularis (strain DAOM 181602 / DAOM 197198 / MUCL 43194) TaxID=747089 RepID=U9TNP2_RHIID